MTKRTIDPNDHPAAGPPAAPLWRRFEAEFLARYRLTIGLVMLGLLVESVLLLPVPLLQGWVVDQLVRLERQGIEHPIARATTAATAHATSTRAATDPPARAAVARAIALALAGTAVLHLARSLLAFNTAATMGRISQEVVVALRGALHQKLMRLPMAYFDSQQTGRVMARVTSDVGGILMFIRGGVLQLLNDLVLSLAIAILLSWLEWRLAIVALVTVPLYALNQRYFFGTLRRLSDQIRAEISALYALLSERVSAVRVVRSFAKEDDELRALDQRIDHHRALSRENSRAAGLLSALAILISGLGTVFVIAYGVILVGRAQLTVGELLAIYALVGQLYQPIVRLTQFQATALATIVSIERLYEIFDVAEPVRDRPRARPVIRPRGALAYRGVSFAYRADLPWVLRDVSLKIEPGMCVGVLGPSGAGKSTLLALAPRLYDLADSAETNGHAQGAITLDGHDIRDLKLADLRRAIALVPQQALLFEGTIRTNLLYARPDAAEREMRHALIAADFASTVDAFPAGLDTRVGERGDSLSGGQRQRLALARALITDPAVLLLDDCTSALDAETESHIQDALNEIVPRRTRVIVSHKIASVRRADLIVVLESGRVIEQGTHTQLVASGGHYAAAVQQQTKALSVWPAGTI